MGMLTGLISCRSCISKHTCHELTSGSVPVMLRGHSSLWPSQTPGFYKTLSSEVEQRTLAELPGVWLRACTHHCPHWSPMIPSFKFYNLSMLICLPITAHTMAEPSSWGSDVLPKASLLWFSQNCLRPQLFNRHHNKSDRGCTHLPVSSTFLKTCLLIGKAFYKTFLWSRLCSVTSLQTRAVQAL